MNRLAALIGRILVAVPFLAFGTMKLADFHGTVGYFAALKIPMTTAAVAAAIIIELLGGLCVVIGFKVRFWAWILFLYLIPVTFVAHNFWTHTGAARMDNELHFIKNIAIMGGLLLLAAFGPGSLSADKR
jgi:putative oxidoreductase